MGARKQKLPFKVRRSAVHGRGAFATRRIRVGQRVIEYTGERIDEAEADRRYDDDAMAHHHTFLFETGRNSFIDAGRKGNEARFINHSCDPNCAAYQTGDRIFIEATRNIQPGVELSYDYSYARTGGYGPGWKELYACHCGAANCRGTILKPPRKRRRAKPKLPMSRKKRR